MKQYHQWLHTRNVKQPISFRKLKYLTKSVGLMKNKMIYYFFLPGLRLQLLRFQSGKILHFPYGSNSQGHKNMFSRSFRDGKTQHTSNPLNHSFRREDRGELCEHWQPILLLWLGETVLLVDFLSTKGKWLFLSKKSNVWPKLFFFFHLFLLVGG